MEELSNKQLENALNEIDTETESDTLILTPLTTVSNIKSFAATATFEFPFVFHCYPADLQPDGQYDNFCMPTMNQMMNQTEILYCE